MQSKRSCFNSTLVKKNLTRFAPLWVLYFLCLAGGMTLLYSDRSAAGQNTESFWFASRVCENIRFMGVVNLLYAPLAAMLLFGDLFQARMCNPLHALPLRRETMFFSNVLSGIFFSLIPTGVITLLILPVLFGSYVENAWQIGLLWFAGVNLEFLCFFGIAIFSVFCTGNRVAMAMVYTVLNGVGFGLFTLVNTLYTPMLYGVVTPDRLATHLTPIADLLSDSLLEVENYFQVEGRAYTTGVRQAAFYLHAAYGKLFVWAGVGIVFGCLGLVLYRRRKLECAGDPIAVPSLRIVFQIACTVGGAVLVVVMGQLFLGFSNHSYAWEKYLLSACGLVVGWFAGKMLLARSVRVFGLKNWPGLAAVALVMALSLAATHFDVLGIASWVPEAEKVRSVTVDNYRSTIELTEEADIRQVLHLQELALEEQIQQPGAYPIAYLETLEPGTMVTYPSNTIALYDQESEYRQANGLTLTYNMANGRTVTRRYVIWMDGEQAQILKPIMSRWEAVLSAARSGWKDTFLWDNILSFEVQGEEVPKALNTHQEATSLVQAIQADCAAGTMAQTIYFHDGYFRSQSDSDLCTPYLNIFLNSGNEWYWTAAYFNIFPDCENTLNWLKERDLLTYDILPGEIPEGK